MKRVQRGNRPNPTEIVDPDLIGQVALVRTPMQFSSLIRIRPAGAAILMLTFIAGCSSPQERRAALREKAGPPQPTLVATKSFLKDRITVGARLSAAMPPRPSPGEVNSGEEGGRTGGRHAGGGRWDDGEGHMGGRMGMGDSGARPHRVGGNGAFPRQALSISLKNASAESITVRIQEVVSILGNFVPFPEKATLAAEESITLEPMRGSLANLDELDLTVALAAGADTDRQTIALRRE
jgi:hypothetical protein